MEKLGIAVAGLFLIALFLFAPFAVIWSLNTLFPVLTIPYNFYTWLSVIVLGLFTRANISVKS